MSATVTFNSPSNASLEVFADGVSYDKSSFDPEVMPQDAVELHLGADYAAAEWSDTTVDFDDVSFDAK
jgi:hypothetical protein